MRKIISIILFTGIAAIANAQDIHFSQYPYSPLNYSPSNTGLFDGDIRVNTLYRRQWSSITVPYKTISIAYDQVLGIPLPSGSRNGAGIIINSDRAGDGDFGTLQALLSFSRLFAINNDSVHFFSAGIQAGIVYSSVDETKLTFDNQFTGDVFNPMAPTKETFERTSFIYPDFNVGGGWTGIFENTTASATVSIQHLLKPDQSLMGEKNGLPMRMNINAGSWFSRDDKISYYPSLLCMTQQEFRELTAGMEFKFRLQESTLRTRAISIGGQYRLGDAIIPSAALYYDQWRFGVSYDINTSDLKKASQSRGGPELNVIYILKKIRYTAAKNICPVY